MTDYVQITKFNLWSA